MYEEVGVDSEMCISSSYRANLFTLKQHLTQKYGSLDIKEIISGENVSIYAIPASVFCSEMSLLESVVKYLREVKSLSFKEISRLTKRAVTTINCTYKKSENKKIFSEQSGLKIPLSVIAYREISTFESIVMYLKYFKDLRYCDIGEILCRNPRVIWQVHNSATKKMSPKHFVNEVGKKIKTHEPGVSNKDLVRILNLKNQFERNCFSVEKFIEMYNDSAVINDIYMPVGAFLSRPLAGVVTYLRDELNFSFKKISSLLKRSAPLIVNSYMPGLEVEDFSFSVPLDILAERKFSVMQIVVQYLKAFGLTNKEAGEMLGREPAVIITHDKRYRAKNV